MHRHSLPKARNPRILDAFVGECCPGSCLVHVVSDSTPLSGDSLTRVISSISWWLQGLIFTGIWVIGHEVRSRVVSCNQLKPIWICASSADTELYHPTKAFVMSSVSWVASLCIWEDITTIFQVVHSFLLTPYFSWKISHHRHHCNHASMERDEVYVPRTRSELGIPNAPRHEIDWDEFFGDTPIYTLYMLVRQQLLAFPAYLCKSSVLNFNVSHSHAVVWNVSGQRNYPRGTNHFYRK